MTMTMTMKRKTPDRGNVTNEFPLTALVRLESERGEHHELCLGVLAQCYPHVPPALQQAIREGIEQAATLGIPVNTRNLEKGGPLFTGGHA